MIYRAYKYRLWPTDAQAESLNRCFAAVRQVYNAALEQRRTYGRRKGSDAFGRDSRFNAPRQAREINFRSQARIARSTTMAMRSASIWAWPCPLLFRPASM